MENIRLPRINVYTCEHGHEIITNDVDEGTSPMFLDCKTKGCKSKAMSAFYRVKPGLVPQWEFYRPNISDVTESQIDYVNNGGLFLRKIKPNNDYPNGKPASSEELKAIYHFVKSYKKSHPRCTDRELKRQITKKFNISNLFV